MTITTSSAVKKRPHYADAATALVDAFGKQRVRINTEYHITVIATKGKENHDVWIPKSGGAKYRLAGARRPKVARHVADVISAIALVDGGHIKTDLTFAREAFDIAELVTDAQAAMPADQQEAVFVDAGWKDGIAQIGFVRLKRVPHGFDVSAASWPEVTKHAAAAEQSAIEHGASFAPNAVIYSDCQTMVEQMQGVYGERLVWLPRERNRAADRIANRRN